MQEEGSCIWPCLVLTALLNGRAIRPPTDILILLLRQLYSIPHDPSALMYYYSEKWAIKHSP